jgi:subtilisin family serine protease
VRFVNGKRSVRYTGPELRWKLGLRSSWFRFAIRKPKPATPAARIARKLQEHGAPAGAPPAGPRPERPLLADEEPVRRLGEVPPYVPDDPLLPARQWHLGAEGIGAFPLAVPGDLIAAAPVVRVAVIDGGIDVASPDLAGLVPPELRRSFVPGRPLRASVHGTAVAGLIAARTGNGAGLAAPGMRVELMDLQVVSGDSTIQPRHEAAAIRWAADHGARVINLSLGALRDPRPRATRGRGGDGFSATEAAAVRYAVARGALVVAAVGNGVDGRAWTFADWPAALPHVLGVGALRRDRRPATFSNRDPVHVDLAAPGTRLISTVPVRTAPSGISVDGPGSAGDIVDDRGELQGTSFAAPLVSGTAALLMALRPDLTASQAALLLTQTARDVHRPGRDAATGPGELDVAAAVARTTAGLEIPAPDDLEPNDDAGALARVVPRDQLLVRASADRWNDSLDVYRVALRRGETLTATLRGPGRGDFDLLVSPPGRGSLAGLGQEARRRVVAGSFRGGTREHVRYRAPRAGAYHVAVWAASGSGAYELALHRSGG